MKETFERVARNDYRCVNCGRLITRGTLYLDTAWRDAGDVWCHKRRHIECCTPTRPSTHSLTCPSTHSLTELLTREQEPVIIANNNTYEKLRVYGINYSEQLFVASTMDGKYLGIPFNVIDEYHTWEGRRLTI